MNYEAQKARDISYQFECKKDAMRQNQDGSWKATLNIHPQEMKPEFLSDAMGQRYVCVMVPIDDNEQPMDKPKSFAGQAKMMAKDEAFQSFVAVKKGQSSCYGEGEAEQWLENQCGVKSCADLIEGNEAGKIFKNVQRDYLQWKDV